MIFPKLPQNFSRGPKDRTLGTRLFNMRSQNLWNQFWGLKSLPTLSTYKGRMRLIQEIGKEVLFSKRVIKSAMAISLSPQPSEEDFWKWLRELSICPWKFLRWYYLNLTSPKKVQGSWSDLWRAVPGEKATWECVELLLTASKGLHFPRARCEPHRRESFQKTWRWLQ